MRKRTFSVRPDWRRRGIRVVAVNEFEALREAEGRDGRLANYTLAVGMGVSKHWWGMRFSRGATCVDVVRIGGAV